MVIKTNFKYSNPLIPLDLNKIIFIVLHHADAVEATPEDIHQWHLVNGWSGAGYNEYIRKDGTVYIMRGDNIGAQCANMNSKSYGICVEGNYDIEKTMPEAQLNALVERIKYNKSRFKNLTDIVPHSKFTATSCCGKYFPYETIMNRVVGNRGTLYDDVAVLIRSGVISTPAYWLNHAMKGYTVDGEYAGMLIKAMANKLRG